MGRLEDLLPDFSTLSDEQLQERVNAVRKDRGISKKIVAHTTVKSRKKKSDSIVDLLKQMSPEDRAKVLKGLT